MLNGVHLPSAGSQHTGFFQTKGSYRDAGSKFGKDQSRRGQDKPSGPTLPMLNLSKVTQQQGSFASSGNSEDKNLHLPAFRRFVQPRTGQPRTGQYGHNVYSNSRDKYAAILTARREKFSYLGAHGQQGTGKAGHNASSAHHFASSVGNASQGMPVPPLKMPDQIPSATKKYSQVSGAQTTRTFPNRKQEQQSTGSHTARTRGDGSRPMQQRQQAQKQAGSFGRRLFVPSFQRAQPFKYPRPPQTRDKNRNQGTQDDAKSQASDVSTMSAGSGSSPRVSHARYRTRKERAGDKSGLNDSGKGRSPRRVVERKQDLPASRDSESRKEEAWEQKIAAREQEKSSDLEVIQRVSNESPKIPAQPVQPRMRDRLPMSPREAESTKNLLPMTPAKVLKVHSQHLTQYEQGEILQYPEIYFIGNCKKKVSGNPSAPSNYGYDDERGDYKCVMHDHIGYRFEMIQVLGQGSFGQVVKVYDYKRYRTIALKIIRNKKRFHHQGLVEVKILEYIRDHDKDDMTNSIRMYDHFYYRHHLCMTFELLSINLYEFMKLNNFQSMGLGLIRRFTVQLLNCLRYLWRHRIIHCDMKPENILLKHPMKSGIKVIDFGSSCFEDEKIYTYIQSRFYRSPEVVLGIPYTMLIDLWSLGCILAELYMGYPLFPGENEAEQLSCIMEVMGVPPKHIIEQSTRRKLFFDSHGNPRIVTNSRGKRRRPNSKDLVSMLRCNDPLFISFLQGCLKWDPMERMTPEEGLQHPWIKEMFVKMRQQPPSEGGRRRGGRSPRRGDR